MQWLWQNPEPVWQWVGLIATLVGTALSLAAVVGAWLARGEAKRAVEATQSLVRAFDALDLAHEVEQLEASLAREDFRHVAAQCNRLRGSIVRFVHENSDPRCLSQHERNALLAASSHSTRITEVAMNSRMKPESKTAQIRVAIGELIENLNIVVGTRRADVRGSKGSVSND